MFKRFGSPVRLGSVRPTRRPARTVPAACIRLAGLVLALGTAAANADPPLRYSFSEGDWLVYERRVRVEPLDAATAGAASASERTEQLQLWCLKVADGAHLLLLDRIPVVDGRAGAMDGVVLTVDARGERRIPAEIRTRLDGLDALFDLIPVLRPAADVRPKWQSPPDHFGRVCEYSLRGPDDERPGWTRLEFQVDDPTGVAAALQRSCSGTAWLNSRQTRVERVEACADDRRLNTRTRSVTVLQHAVKNDPQWSRLRADEAEKYLKALQFEDYIARMAVRDPGEIEDQIRQLRRAWDGFAANVEPRSRSPFGVLGRSRLAELARIERKLRQRAAYARRQLARPAPPWTLQTPGGETVTSEAVRSGVTIECLWAADAPMSVRQLTSLKALQAVINSNETRIVCLNADGDLPAARRAVAAAGEGLFHVLAGPVRSAEGLEELPVLRVLDSAGTVRNLVFGWHPDLASELAWSPD